MGQLLREYEARANAGKEEVRRYEEYIESWAHEIKTPLALMTFVLDNRKDEMEPVVYQRLEYARTQIQDDVERMLYYARLSSAHQDYQMEWLFLRECCQEVLEEYQVLLKERGVLVSNEVAEDLEIVSDKKGLEFIVRQIIGNAVKYADKEKPEIHLKTRSESERVILSVIDNGNGIKPYDTPFVFDRGYTGNTGGERKKATGMGLYLANQAAGELGLMLRVDEEVRRGYKMEIMFPVVEE